MPSRLQVIGHYEIEAVAGHGGMGVVYRARDTRLGRLVALKVIAPHLARDVVMRERLNRESTLVASLDHPNIVPLYEAGEVDGSLFLASRWVDGEDLGAYVAREPPLTAERVVRMVGQVAAALAAAHRAGLIHRDVKPSNVLVTFNAHVYLTDFGVARRNSDLSGLTATEQLLGTLDYVSPEQIQGERVDPRADVYALGGLLYFTLSGEVPFPREGHAAKLYAHLSADPPTVTTARADVPAAFDAVIWRALAKDPADRWPDVEAFRAALFAALPRKDRSSGRAAAERRQDGATPRHGGPVVVAAGDLDATTPDSVVGRAMSAAAADPGTVATPADLGTDPRVMSRVPVRRSERSGPSPLVAAAIAAPAVQPREPVAPPAPAPPSPDEDDPSADAPVPGSRRRRWAGPLAALLLLLVGLATAAGLSRLLEDKKEGAQTVAVARGGADVAVGGGRVWISVPGSSRLVGVPASDLEGRRTTLDVGAPVTTLSGRGGHLVAAAGRALVDLPAGDRRRAERFKLPFAPGAVAVGNGVSWAAGASNRQLLRLEDGDAIRTTTSSPIDGLATGAGAVWVAHADEGTVGRVNARTRNPTALRRLGGAPTAIAATATAIWVADPERDVVLRLDPRTGKAVGAPVPVPGDPVALAADSRQVWVARRADNAVTALDARTGRPVNEVGSAQQPVGVALTDDAVWVVGRRGQLSRISR